MKHISEWKAGDKEPAIFVVAVLLVIILVAVVVGLFVPDPNGPPDRRSQITIDP